MESLKVHKRSRVEGHLQILQILLVLLVLLDLAEETLSEFLWFLLDLFEPLKRSDSEIIQIEVVLVLQEDDFIFLVSKR